MQAQAAPGIPSKMTYSYTLSAPGGPVVVAEPLGALDRRFNDVAVGHLAEGCCPHLHVAAVLAVRNAIFERGEARLRDGRDAAPVRHVDEAVPTRAGRGAHLVEAVRSAVPM